MYPDFAMFDEIKISQFHVSNESACGGGMKLAVCKLLVSYNHETSKMSIFLNVDLETGGNGH